MIAAALPAFCLRIKSGLQIGEAGMLLRSPFLRLERLHASRLYSEVRRQGIENISFEIESMRRTFPAMAGEQWMHYGSANIRASGAKPSRSCWDARAGPATGRSPPPSTRP